MRAVRTTALLGLGAFVALVALQHLWRADDLPPAVHFVSEYARGPGGWVQAVAFLAWAVSLAATAVLVLRAPSGGRWIARALVGLGLAVAAVGAVACAAFVTETVGGELPEDVVRTTAGRLHDLGSAVILFGLVGAVLASLRLVPRWSHRLAVLGLGLLFVAVPAGLVAAGQDAPGWGQRGIIAVGCLAQLLLVRAVRAGAPRAGGRG